MKTIIEMLHLNRLKDTLKRNAYRVTYHLYYASNKWKSKKMEHIIGGYWIRQASSTSHRNRVNLFDVASNCDSTKLGTKATTTEALAIATRETFVPTNKCTVMVTNTWPFECVALWRTHSSLCSLHHHFCCNFIHSN